MLPPHVAISGFEQSPTMLEDLVLKPVCLDPDGFQIFSLHPFFLSLFFLSFIIFYLFHKKNAFYLLVAYRYTALHFLSDFELTMFGSKLQVSTIPKKMERKDSRGQRHCAPPSLVLGIDIYHSKHGGPTVSAEAVPSRLWPVFAVGLGECLGSAQI